MMNLIKENVKNLTSLWRIVGDRVHAYTRGDDFDISAITDSEWPNRLWFHHDINERSLKAAKESLLSVSTNLIVPYWDIYQSRSYEFLESNGFEKLFEQVGMSLALTQAYETIGTLQIEKVTSKKTALVWDELFKQAFNYRIHHDLLMSSYMDIDYLIAYHNKQPVGTAILHHSKEAVIGVHAMGIIPEMRRKGFAEQMMLNLLGKATEQGFKYATLQASDLGKGLYLKLGFEEQFIMKNYVLQHPM
ncbi:GNAT family N-acetyltransferase [Fulvivirgaceae bacterium BMA10]|uniref:GNAT family N-acetyltransferase n=1 Tax=Splendidivirga corallicola TaxID=3051826 RepID=A0ABT8KPL0_9BACT|nr:GNAT family N-acetyltransferase [Fulvivirgaceae bacterium BMA10]